jgi:hypothetical protein
MIEVGPNQVVKSNVRRRSHNSHVLGSFLTRSLARYGSPFAASRPQQLKHETLYHSLFVMERTNDRRTA